MPRKKAPSPKDFEAALDTLSNIVEAMEKGDLSLEESLQSFEKGTQLIEQCQKTLDEAEQRIQLLSGQSKNAKLTPYKDNHTNDNDADPTD